MVIDEAFYEQEYKSKFVLTFFNNKFPLSYENTHALPTLSSV